jgi:hypothetical protein
MFLKNFLFKKTIDYSPALFFVLLRGKIGVYNGDYTEEKQ